MYEVCNPSELGFRFKSDGSQTSQWTDARWSDASFMRSRVMHVRMKI